MKEMTRKGNRRPGNKNKSALPRKLLKIPYGRSVLDASFCYANYHPFMIFN